MTQAIIVDIILEGYKTMFIPKVECLEQLRKDPDY